MSSWSTSLGYSRSPGASSGGATSRRSSSALSSLPPLASSSWSSCPPAPGADACVPSSTWRASSGGPGAAAAGSVPWRSGACCRRGGRHGCGQPLQCSGSAAVVLGGDGAPPEDRFGDRVVGAPPPALLPLLILLVTDVHGAVAEASGATERHVKGPWAKTGLLSQSPTRPRKVCPWHLWIVRA